MTLGLKPDYDNGLPSIGNNGNDINNYVNSEIKLPGYSGNRANKAKGKLPKFDDFHHNIGNSDLPGYSSSFDSSNLPGYSNSFGNSEESSINQENFFGLVITILLLYLVNSKV